MRPGFWLVLFIAAGVSLTNLGAARLWDRDEPRNAQCSREMLEANNWIVPTFDGQLRTHKPVLLYWCQMVAYKVLGVNEFAARLPSALAGIATVLLTYLIAARFSTSDTATWSGIALATMLMFVLAARAATPDALLIATTTLSLYLFVRFAFVPTEAGTIEFASTSSSMATITSAGDLLANVTFVWPSLSQWSLVYAACGLACLAKGPIGLILPVAIMGLTTLIVAPTSRSHHPAINAIINLWIHARRMRPLLALFMVMIVAGPWYTAVAWATDGIWVKDFLFTHNVSRAVQTMEGHDGPPFLFYIAALLVGTFPWSCFAIPVLLTAWTHFRLQSRQHIHQVRQVHPLIGLSLAWVAVYVACFSLASTKLPSYVTPCHPAIALVAGLYMAAAIRKAVDRPRWMVAALAVGLLVGISVFIAIGGPAGRLIPTVRPLAFAGVVLAVASTLAIAFATRKKVDYAMRSFIIGGVAFVWLLHGFGPMLVDRGRQDLDALQAALRANSGEIFLLESAPEPSWVFYSNRRIRQVLSSELEGAAGTGMRIERSATATVNSVPVFLDSQYLRIEMAETSSDVGLR